MEVSRGAYPQDIGTTHRHAAVTGKIEKHIDAVAPAIGQGQKKPAFGFAQAEQTKGQSRKHELIDQTDEELFQPLSQKGQIFIPGVAPSEVLFKTAAAVNGPGAESGEKEEKGPKGGKRKGRDQSVIGFDDDLGHPEGEIGKPQEGKKRKSGDFTPFHQ